MKRMRFCAEILQPARVIMELAVGRQRQGVDGEVAAPGVLLEIAAEADDGVTAVGLDILAQRRHLERRAGDDDGHRAMLDPGRDALEPRRLRGRHNSLGQGGGREVDLMRRQAEQRVAHGAADDAGFRPGLRQRGEERREARIVQQALGRVHLNAPGTRRPFSTWAGT